MALVLVTHNMGVVADIARRVAVMYAGQVMEERAASSIFAAPQHPYTAALLSAMPERHVEGGRLATIPGLVPGLSDRPAGCLFAPRCADSTPQCAQRPALRPWQDGLVRCHYPLALPSREAIRAQDVVASAGLSP